MTNLELDTRTISKIIQKAYDQIKEILMNTYPNLYFYISPTGNVTCWVRTPDGRDGAGISMEMKINAGQIYVHQERYLNELNDLVEPVHTQPDKFFYCTECGKVKPKSEFKENVFAGYYCIDCAKKPTVAALLEESHKAGFYD